MPRRNNGKIFPYTYVTHVMLNTCMLAKVRLASMYAVDFMVAI